MLKLIKIGCFILLSYQCIETQNPLFNTPEILIKDEQGMNQIVYQLEENKLDEQYDEVMDFLDEVNSPYVRNIASLLYAGYPSNIEVNGHSFIEQFNLREEDIYTFNGIDTNGFQLARGLTQIALNDCVELYSNQSLTTHEAFNEAIYKMKENRRSYFNEYDLNLFNYYEALIEAAITLQVPLNQKQTLPRILYYPSEQGSSLIGVSNQQVAQYINTTEVNKDEPINVQNILYWMLLIAVLLGLGSYANYRSKHK